MLLVRTHPHTACTIPLERRKYMKQIRYKISCRGGQTRCSYSARGHCIVRVRFTLETVSARGSCDLLIFVVFVRAAFNRRVIGKSICIQRLNITLYARAHISYTIRLLQCNIVEEHFFLLFNHCRVQHVFNFKFQNGDIKYVYDISHTLVGDLR